MHLGRITTSIVVTFALLLAGLLTAPAATAHHDGCGWAHDEPQLLAQNWGPCRMTFIIDPGQGNLASRQQLLDNAAMYDELGYDRNFLYWSGERVISGRGHRWMHCDDNGADDTCANDAWADGPVSNTFADGNEPDLTVFGDAGGFIARVCGNSKAGVRWNDRYHPTLNGGKFHDRNRDGVRQAGEEPLAGWTFRIEQASAKYGPVLGVVGHATTGADGRWSFDLVHASPGTYRVVEIGNPDWKVTTADSFQVEVPEGAENTAFEVGPWGNAPTTADVAKTDFALIDPPSEIKADTPTDLTVRLGLLNNGPADAVTVTDTLTASSPNPDCSFSPQEVVLSRQLAVGVPDVTDVTITVTCTEPSNHMLQFDDRLVLDMAGFRDPDPSDNTRTITHALEVWDSSDLAVTGPRLDCPARTDIEVPVTCTATATVTNHGPYGPTATATDLAIVTPADCTAELLPGTAPTDATLGVGASAEVSQSWTVTCAQRSFHPMAATVTARPLTAHVEDREPANDSVVAEDVVEVFEPADLAVTITDLRCSEREANPTDSACTATIDVTNHGPARAVAAVATTSADPAADCSVTPSAALDESLSLDAGETRTLTRDYRLTCTDPIRHDVAVAASVRTDEPHAEDRHPDNDTDRLIWLPSDAKPRSLPSSVNVGSAGSLPFALLSTVRIDTVAEVDVPTIRYGVTGTEASVQRCAPGGEDVNDDGRGDLVCTAETAATGITCSTTELVATGRLRSGVRFISQDDVNVTGCRR